MSCCCWRICSADVLALAVAVACIYAVTDIFAFDGIPSVAGVPVVNIPAVPGRPTVATIPAVDGIVLLVFLYFGVPAAVSVSVYYLRLC
jgi:hypothetical protein